MKALVLSISKAMGIRTRGIQSGLMVPILKIGLVVSTSMPPVYSPMAINYRLSWLAGATMHSIMFHLSQPFWRPKRDMSISVMEFQTRSCFSAAFILKTHGGGIASTGCTGYGFGNGGDPNTLSGALEMNFFYQIGNGTENLAQAHSLAITKFINENAIDQIGAFCITNWALFGDASLKIGGYSS